MTVNMILYEIKARRKDFRFIIAEALVFLTVSIVMWRVPAFPVKLAEIINKSEIAVGFFGIEGRIEGVKYEDIMFSLLLLFLPFFLFRNITHMAKAIQREAHLGTGIYFFSQSISKIRLLLYKLIVGAVELLIEVVVIGVIVWRFSLIGAAHVEVLNLIITERVQSAVMAMGFVGMIALTVGFAYGCISNVQRSGAFSVNLMITGYFIAIIPNIFNCALGNMGIENMNIVWLEKLISFFSKIRWYDILYWSNPFVAKDGVELQYILGYGFTGVFLMMTGAIIFNRKDI